MPGFTRREFFSLGASIAGVTALAGCGLTQQDAASTQRTAFNLPQVGDPLYTIPKLTGIAWFNRMEQGVQMYGTDSGNKAIFFGDEKTARQAQVIEEAVAAGAAALLVTPYELNRVEDALRAAMDQGVYVITHEATEAPEKQCAHWDMEPFHNEDYGINLMKELAAAMGEEGDYLQMVASVSTANHMTWVKAAEQYQLEHYPKMRRVGDYITSEENPEVAYEKLKKALVIYPDVRGIQGSASVDAVGAGQVIEEGQLHDTISVCCSGTPRDTQAFLVSGAVDMIQFWDPGMAAYAQNVLASMVINGEDISEGISLIAEGYENISLDGNVIYGNSAWVTVTRENVNDYGYWFV